MNKVESLCLLCMRDVTVRRPRTNEPFEFGRDARLPEHGVIAAPLLAVYD